MTNGVLLLTFDDIFVPEWSTARELFAAHDARVSFFVSALDRLTPADWPLLRELAADGHTVGAHGLRHLNAAERVAEVGSDTYLRDEVDPCVAGLRSEGLDPRTFAYPYSARSETSDALLTKVFTRLRGGLSVPEGRELADIGDFFVPVAELPERRILIGAGADNGAQHQPRGNSDAMLLGGLRRAAERGEVFTLIAHAIADTHEHNYIAPARIDWLLTQAAELGLRCLGFDDLPEAGSLITG
ncbi:polysaccharide deacetylase family protein [Streptomyces sp. NBC_00825]|uniref:polysaccharide deacetylase family protein n=1 Tax=unclassified Streptomyces TaxID=2593676 RepID=UPI00225B9515|nr:MULTISPECIES: polysaccharide deacetylase family protein [unclassified Streptomyces]WTB52137.1 polysaccharide deacetylase family protein [Streptomyces sp. NBC_00826]WTH94973.1 polysaccharide deacetylase family protein [Streptomyces sp. NBC_00825]WTI03706.1 polysaccharide deacetylase family protein [Streptomyces sp. NBC_00822]MCX4869277.1 polysaccharide deacetylase family protein [Streptomyces sp. NBC_00906]MCX4900516.1 polysaccharide deacetylase family protein [Streptomyces sp. NBC_00892]